MYFAILSLMLPLGLTYSTFANSFDLKVLNTPSVLFSWIRGVFPTKSRTDFTAILESFPER
jgi:hypothetical protein